MSKLLFKARGPNLKARDKYSYLAEHAVRSLLLILAISFGMALLFAGNGSAKKPLPETVKVGVFLDLSRGTSSFGRAALNGIKLAAAELNAKGGKDFELIVEDDLGRPEQAATVVERLIDLNKVQALIGEVTSSNSLAGAPIAQKARVPMITAATHPAITQVGNYIFRVSYIDPFQGEALAQFANRTLRAKRIALLVDASSDYSTSLATAFEKSLISLRGRVVMKQTYIQGDRDFAAQLIAIKRSNPDVVFVPAYHSEAGLIAKQARQLGFNKPLLGGDGWDSPELWDLGGTALNGSFIANHYAADDPSPANRAFIAKYRAHYEGQEPQVFAALGYDAMKLLAHAIEDAGTTEGPALREALARTIDFEGVTGPISMNDNRNSPGAVILRLQDRKFVYFESVLQK